MNLLPHWVLTDKFPAFYDSESKTALEQTARVYGAMQELIKEYNSFVDSVNQHILDFENAAKKDYEIFTTAIRQEFQDFIDVVTLKIQSQDSIIEDAVSYMKTNLSESIDAALLEMRANGSFSQEVLKVYADMENQIAALNSRMNTFTTLGEGSTTGDAELQDGRTDYTGKTWDNIGSHIRGVTSELSSEIAELFVMGKNRLLLEHKRENTNGFTFDFDNGVFSLNGTVEATENINIPLNVKYINDGNYTLTVRRKSGSGVVDTMNICTVNSSGSLKSSFISISSLTASNPIKSASGEIIKDDYTLSLRFRVTAGAVLDNLVFNVQLEQGTESTEFVEAQVSINANSSYADKQEVEALKSNIANLDGISPLRVCLVGDIHITDSTTSYSGANWLERITLLADAVNKEHNKKPFDFLLCTGDLVYHPSADNSESYWIDRLAYLFNMPVYVMAGNHEYAFSEERFREMVGNPRQFSIADDSWYFICLDTYVESSEYTGIDEEYLRAELEKSRDKKVVICGHYFEDSDKDLLVSLIAEYPNIVTVTYGHTHSWGQSQLSNGTWTLDNGSFDNPRKSWETVGTDENPTTNLWGFRVLETEGKDLVTYQIQPAHNYSGVNIDLLYSVNDKITIGTFDIKEGADCVIGKHINNKKYSDRFKYLESNS